MAVKAKQGKEIRIVTKLPEPKWDGQLTNSSRSCFANCRKKWMWSYLYRLSPRSIQLPFFVGDLVHGGLEQMYLNPEFSMAEFEKRVCDKCDSVCMQEHVEQKQADEIWKQRALIMGILRGYEQKYMAKDRKAWKKMWPESQFEFPLGNGWTNRGKRDMIVETVNKKMGLVEHKTASSLSATYLSRLPLDPQIQGYASSIRRQFKRIPNFVIYNVMRKSALKQKETETFDQYCARITADYLNRPDEYFYREILSFSSKAIDAYDAELEKFAVEMERAIKEMYFYNNYAHCTAYNKPCPFMRLCTEGANEDTLSLFRVREHTHEELSNEEAE